LGCWERPPNSLDARARPDSRPRDWPRRSHPQLAGDSSSNVPALGSGDDETAPWRALIAGYAANMTDHVAASLKAPTKRASKEIDAQADELARRSRRLNL
jgi:hypothetical protein